jgi:hypothetical protein
VITGTAGNDVITARDGNDVVFGLGGDDVVCGDQGADQVFGGDGQDRLYGGSGDDLLDGGDGKDRLFGATGRNVMAGGSGDDRFKGGPDIDIVSGEAGNDAIDCGDGPDQAAGGPDADLFDPSCETVSDNPPPDAPPAPPLFSIADLNGPYLQRCASREVMVVWETPSPSDGVVAVSRPGTAEVLFTGPGPAIRHAVSVTGLKPGTPYQYRVISGGRELARSSFITAPAPDSTTGFTFAVLGDSGTGGPEQFRVAGELEAMQPRVVLHAGDLVYPSGSAALYGPNFFTPYRNLLTQACIFPVAGDHDLIEEGGQPYFDRFFPPEGRSGSELYYSFDYGQVHFVMLDTVPFERGGPDAPRQIKAMSEWLDADLDRTDRPWKVAVMHHPPYSSGVKHGSYMDVRAALSPILERHGVTLAFSGDDHDYERSYPVREFEDAGPGVTYIVSGGGGAVIRAVGASDFTAFSQSKHHAVRVNVSAQSLSLDAVDQHGVVFDTHEVPLNDTASPVFTGNGNPTVQGQATVCAADAPAGTACDYQADGVDDQVEVNRALAACPVTACTVTLSPGTFNTEARDEDDSINLKSRNRLVFSQGTVIRFKGVVEPADRYVIDLDGTVQPVDEAYVGGPGVIEVTQVMDHGIHLKGRSDGVVIGDGLLLRHLDPGISFDEGIQVTGSVDVQRLTIRDLTVEDFGRVQNGAQGIEFAGLVRQSLVQRLTSAGNRRALVFRGIADPMDHVLAQSGAGPQVSQRVLTDRDATTTATVTLGPADFVLASSPGRFLGVDVTVTGGNATGAEWLVSVSDGSGGWLSVPVIRDTTALSGAPLARSGMVQFDPPAGQAWAEDEHDGRRGYWVKLALSVSGSPATLAEVRAVQAPYTNVVTDSTSTGEVNEAFWVRTGYRNEFRRITVVNPGMAGVRLSANKNAPEPWQNLFEDVSVSGGAAQGMLLEGAPETTVVRGALTANQSGLVQKGPPSPDLQVTGVVIASNRSAGITLTGDRSRLTGVEVSGNGQDLDLPSYASRSGVLISGGSGHLISGSTITGGAGTPTQAYGVHLTPAGGATIISASQVSGNLITDIYDAKDMVTVQ